VLFVHEVHRVMGLKQDEFEAAYRDEFLGAVAADPGARLLWYWNHAHGSSISFNVVTLTGVADWEAWGRLARRVQDGDLAPWARRLDQMRYGCEGAIFAPAPWSPLQEVDLAAVPADPTAKHALTMYIEDTVRLEGVSVKEGVEAAGKAHPLREGTADGGLSRLTGAFQPVPGGGRRRELVMLQQVLDLDLLAQYYLDGSPPPSPAWSGAHGSVPFADTWSTRVLRAAEWSPLW
jgi:hypothetical protein